MESKPPQKNLLPVVGFSVSGFAACVLAATLIGFARVAIAGPGEPDIAQPILGNMLCIAASGIVWLGILVSGTVWARKRQQNAAATWLTVECALAALFLLLTAVMLRNFTFADPP